MLCFCVFSLYVCALVCVPDGLGGQMSTLDHLDLELYICGCWDLSLGTSTLNF